MTTWKESIWPETDIWEKEQKGAALSETKGEWIRPTRFCVSVQSLLAPSPFVLDIAGVEADWTRNPSHSAAHLGSPDSQFKTTPLHFIVAENG